MSNPMATRTKYRPVLTSSQITHILALAKSDVISGNDSPELSYSIIGILAPFEAKIKNEGIVPAYTEQPSQQAKLLDSLGGVAIPEGMPKEEYWERCFDKFSELGGANALTVTELKACNEWRYLHDLMSPEEMKAFEDYTANG